MSRTTNGIGWVVQEFALPGGWRAIGRVYLSRDDAMSALHSMTDGNAQRRIYEALS
jgi:hypothetical protein